MINLLLALAMTASAQSISDRVDQAYRNQPVVDNKTEFIGRYRSQITMLADVILRARLTSDLEIVCDRRLVSAAGGGGGRDGSVPVGFAAQLSDGRECKFVLDEGQIRCALGGRPAGEYKFKPTRSNHYIGVNGHAYGC